MKNGKGFTLIELLAIIVILAVIMVVAVPQVLNVVNGSKDGAWKNNVNMIKNGITKNSRILDPETGEYNASIDELCNYPEWISDFVKIKDTSITCTSRFICDDVKPGPKAFNEENLNIVKVAKKEDKVPCDYEYTFLLKGEGQFKDKKAKIVCKNNKCETEIIKIIPDIDLADGLYDENNNLISTYAEFVSDTGFDVEADAPYYEQAYNYHEGGLFMRLSNNAEEYVYINDALSSDKYESVVKIVLPSGISRIGNEAFSGCDKLQSIVLRSGITSIGYSAFAYESNLEKVVLPAGLRTIGGRAFAGTLISDIDIPNTVIEIGYEAFQSCTELKKIVIPSGIKTIEEGTFSNCYNLNKIILPDGLISIGKSAFDGAGIKTIDIPNTVTTIENMAFWNCTLLENIKIPSNITIIEEDTFFGCENLQSVVLPEGLVEIKSSAFLSCNQLKEVIIPSTVTTIGDSAFGSCNHLEKVDIRGNVTSFGKKVFAFDDIKQYVVSSDNQTFSINNGVLFSKDGSILYAYPIGKSGSSYTIPSGVTRIESGSFAGTSLTSISIPNTVTTIGSYAFADAAITSLVIPNSVTIIEDHAFSGTDNLKNITLSSTLTYIGDYAFGNSGITSLTIPSSVTRIGTGAFQWTYYFTKATFENPNGWKAGNTSLNSSSLSNKSTAATYLGSTYKWYTWTRSN